MSNRCGVSKLQYLQYIKSNAKHLESDQLVNHEVCDSTPAFVINVLKPVWTFVIL
jgi:hypothetical protein